MKKIIICSALLFAFFSCSKEQQTQTPVNPSDASAIEFNSSLNMNIVRGIPVEGDKLKENFGVFGYCDPMKETNIDLAMSCLDPDFMFNQKVDYSHLFKIFSYSPICYWPTKGWVNFFAYAPYSSSHSEFCNPLNNHDEGYPVIEYTVGSNVTNQQDLMVSEALKQVGTSDCVNFDFKHALTKVGVEAYLDSNCGSQYQVIITKVEFKKIKDHGKFRYAYLADSDHNKWWCDVDGHQTYNVGVCDDWSIFGDADVAAATEADPDFIWWPTRPHGTTVHHYNGDCYDRVNAYNQYLLAIPQCFDHSCGAELVVTYVIYNKITCVSTYYEAEISLNDTQCWEPGFCIDYVICIELNAVSFDACVTPWEDCIEVHETVSPGDC